MPRHSKWPPTEKEWLALAPTYPYQHQKPQRLLRPPTKNMRHWKETSALFVPRFERFELLHRDFRRQPETQQRAAADLGDVLVTPVA
jgi:hypothetical protein